MKLGGSPLLKNVETTIPRCFILSFNCMHVWPMKMRNPTSHPSLSAKRVSSPELRGRVRGHMSIVNTSMRTLSSCWLLYLLGNTSQKAFFSSAQMECHSAWGRHLRGLVTFDMEHLFQRGNVPMRRENGCPFRNRKNFAQSRRTGRHRLSENGKISYLFHIGRRFVDLSHVERYTSTWNPSRIHHSLIKTQPETAPFYPRIPSKSAESCSKYSLCPSFSRNFQDEQSKSPRSGITKCKHSSGCCELINKGL
mmetsp:Transcript_24450/g.38106  ORF Transcript_24450/g.38106 Transcript_24450/m.38106 type:complete len:251 (-) Transcript_24450:21-773(-)